MSASWEIHLANCFPFHKHHLYKKKSRKLIPSMTSDKNTGTASVEWQYMKNYEENIYLKCFIRKVCYQSICFCSNPLTRIYKHFMKQLPLRKLEKKNWE
jgi:hypothetical protein